MQIRTDLALEAAEKAPDMPRLTEQDVEKTQLMEGEATITRIHIHSGAGSEALGRAPGRYITVEVPPLSDNDDKLVEYARLIGRELAALLPERGTVLVTGLGNESITPDALGPRASPAIFRGSSPAAAAWTTCAPRRCWLPVCWGKPGWKAARSWAGCVRWCIRRR